MTGPDLPYPGYGPSPYPPYGDGEYAAYGGQPPPSPGPRLQLGERTWRRPHPRLGIALAGAGMGLVVLGVIVWSASYLFQGLFESFRSESNSADDTRRILGVLLSLAVIACGYLLAVRWRRGPLSAAGVSASALGVPSLMIFATFSGSSGEISLDGVVWVSIVVWLASYVFLPGTRGHAFYLGATTAMFAGYVAEKVADGNLDALITTRLEPALNAPVGATTQPDTTTVGAVLLVFGVAYYAIAFGLERARRAGAAVALLPSAFLATSGGLIAVSPDTTQAGTGVLLVVLGLAIASCASRYERRFTTWAGSGGVALGLALIAAKIAGTGQIPLVGVLFIVGGLVLVVVALLVSRSLREADEMLLGGTDPPPRWIAQRTP